MICVMIGGKEMSLQEVWNRIERGFVGGEHKILITEIKRRQFLFLWGRGGKQFVEYCLDDDNGNQEVINGFSEIVMLAEEGIDNHNLTFDDSDIAPHLWAMDFLGCVAIDKEKVKEKIRELEGKK